MVVDSKRLAGMELMQLSQKVVSENFLMEYNKICNQPFKGSQYQTETVISTMLKQMELIEEFYRSQREEYEDKKSYMEWQHMRRIALVFEMVGVFYHIDFPEKYKIKLKRWEETSDLNYLEVLFYMALVLSMPLILRDSVQIEAQYEVSFIPKGEFMGRTYYIDFVIVHQATGQLLYAIECDGYNHKFKEEEDLERKEQIEKRFDGCQVIRIKKNEIYEGKDGWDKEPKKRNDVMNTARKFWAKVLEDQRFQSKVQDEQNAECKSESKQALDVSEAPVVDLSQALQNSQPKAQAVVLTPLPENRESILRKMNETWTVCNELIECKKKEVYLNSKLNVLNKQNRSILTGTIIPSIIIWIGISFFYYLYRFEIINKDIIVTELELVTWFIPDCLQICIGLLLVIIPIGLMIVKIKKSKLANQINSTYKEEIENRQRSMSLIESNIINFNFIPKTYTYPMAMWYLHDLFLNRRADTIKEALNLYEGQLHKWRMEKNEYLSLIEEQMQIMRNIQFNNR